MNSEKIDFVILWVDESDSKWLEDRKKYNPSATDDVSEKRYRNWDNLQYFFRGVEKFAPWVNRIFFITYGHIPKWLNMSHPKLKVVKHEEYMPAECLPTFNSNPIELMLNRIEELSNHFVLFNDDMFLIKKTEPSDFFFNGLPCDSACLNIHSISPTKMSVYSSLQATGIINKYFDMKKSIMGNWKKWFSPCYGKQMLNTLYLLPCKAFPEIKQIHLPYSYLKSTFDTVWEKEGDELLGTCHNRYRTKLDYSHWTMRNWQIASGNFYPRKFSFGKSFYISDEIALSECIRYMRDSKGKVICINDGDMSLDFFSKCKSRVNGQLETLLPNKSSFEI
ncbi:stealth family protein [Butyrivibrio sp. WCD3002]|uniref:stealth family protein n=1 Tax=Butyrivibrio sp. WCD3002 TaxID=1280676 RepID=UPI0004256F8B|nr:stealth family protein [Butyrivibrio sp. WCD3002]